MCEKPRTRAKLKHEFGLAMLDIYRRAKSEAGALGDAANLDEV